MSVLLIGVTHRDLPLEVFERFAVTADDTPKLLAALTARDHVSEAVVLATCNRTEIYVKAERFTVRSRTSATCWSTCPMSPRTVFCPT